MYKIDLGGGYANDGINNESAQVRRVSRRSLVGIV